MNRRVLQIVIGFALLIALTAGLLLRVRSNYVLGEPGLKLVNVPIYNEETNIVSEISAYLPEEVGEYKSTRVEYVSTIEQAMLPPDTVYGRRVYTAEDRFQALISVVVMGTDRTSIHKPQYCLTGQGQEIIGSELITIPITKPEPYELKAMKLTTRSQQRDGQGNMVPLSGVFIYWFVADGKLTPHHGERMWMMGKELLTTGLLQRWAYVAYFARCAPGQEDELTERLRGF
ncbi:MAG: exosortase-associated EpsI family protein, partial [Limisphaerales bacterium]